MSIFKQSVSWADAGYPEKPGPIPWLDGELIIEKKHLENWKLNPTAIYEVSSAAFSAVSKSTLLAAGNTAFDEAEGEIGYESDNGRPFRQPEANPCARSSSHSGSSI
jgi:hypothetical protein